jgi:hypothetical protein
VADRAGILGLRPAARGQRSRHPCDEQRPDQRGRDRAGQQAFADRAHPHGRRDGDDCSEPGHRSAGKQRAPPTSLRYPRRSACSRRGQQQECDGEHASFRHLVGSEDPEQCDRHQRERRDGKHSDRTLRHARNRRSSRRNRAGANASPGDSTKTPQTVATARATRLEAWRPIRRGHHPPASSRSHGLGRRPVTCRTSTTIGASRTMPTTP